MSKHKTVALLPIKHNSERVKDKNFKIFLGKPLFHWILEGLLRVSEIDKIIINTDAQDRLLDKGLILTEKIIIRERRKNLCGDGVSMNLIIQDDINAVESETYIMTHTTNPLIKTATIEKALRYFKNQNKCDSLFTTNKVQTRFYDQDSKPINHNPDNLVKTQDLPIWFEENSCLYIFTPQSFKKNNARIGSSPIMFPIPKIESIDIDDSEDWFIAESVMDSIVKDT